MYSNLLSGEAIDEDVEPHGECERERGSLEFRRPLTILIFPLEILPSTKDQTCLIHTLQLILYIINSFYYIHERPINRGPSEVV